MALALVWKKQSEGDCEVLRCDKEVCGGVSEQRPEGWPNWKECLVNNTGEKRVELV